MKKNSKKLIFALFALLSITLGTSTALAYDVWYYGGFTPYPATVYPYSTFDSESITAMNDAASQWNGAGEGNLVSIGSVSSNTSYPNDNNRNEVPKGYRGSNTYLMQTNATSIGTVWNGKILENALTEADIDVNLSHAWGNGSTSL